MGVSRRNFLSSLWPAALSPISALRCLSPATDTSGGGSRFGVKFEDVSQQAGLRDKVYYGGKHSWNYILETTGCGVAFIDYNNDDWPDIFVVNDWRLEGFSKEEAPSNRLCHNNRDGTFTDVTEAAGLRRSGWGQGVCVGDYDNDDFSDLFLT